MLRISKAFRRSTQGMAAVEFALIAPAMIGMFYGAMELSAAVDCDSRVTRVASTMSDLVAQATTVSTSDMTNIFGAGAAIIYPYPTGTMKVVVSSLVDDGNGGVKVAWSNAQNATPRTVNSAVTIPTGLVTKGSGGSVILAEVTYVYSPPITHFLGHAVTMTNKFYSRPRRSVTVTHS